MHLCSVDILCISVPWKFCVFQSHGNFAYLSGTDILCVVKLASDSLRCYGIGSPICFACSLMGILCVNCGRPSSTNVWCPDVIGRDAWDWEVTVLGAS